MNAMITKMMEAGVALAIERDRAWLPCDRRGRWVVVESGTGRNRPRARRFSSLSRARAFAREVDSFVRRWRRVPPGGGTWGRQSPWDRARAAVPWVNWMIKEPKK